MPRLPKSVEKQAELADQIYQQAYGTPQQPPEAPKAAETPSAPPADSTPPAPADSAPSAEPAKAEPEKPAEPSEEGDLNHWKQRAKVAEGRLTKEMPRMAQTIREMKDQIADLQTKLREAEAKPAAPADAGVKPEEVEQYGKDFIDMVQRVARNATPGVDPNLQAQVKEVTETQRRVARQQFFDQLGREAPQWEALNTDEGFLAYLGGLDPYTGRPRQELFDDAYEKLDAWRIANFFNSYNESRRVEPESPKPSLADQVVPSANKANKPPPSKKVWTTADVARFYDELRRGVHTQDEAARIEQDIFAAQKEGRLR
jgi:hypothetical protein